MAPHIFLDRISQSVGSFLFILDGLLGIPTGTGTITPDLSIPFHFRSVDRCRSWGIGDCERDFAIGCC